MCNNLGGNGPEQMIKVPHGKMIVSMEGSGREVFFAGAQVPFYWYRLVELGYYEKTRIVDYDPTLATLVVEGCLPSNRAIIRHKPGVGVEIITPKKMLTFDELFHTSTGTPDALSIEKGHRWKSSKVFKPIRKAS